MARPCRPPAEYNTRRKAQISGVTGGESYCGHRRDGSTISPLLNHFLTRVVSPIGQVNGIAKPIMYVRLTLPRYLGGGARSFDASLYSRKNGAVKNVIRREQG